MNQTELERLARAVVRVILEHHGSLEDTCTTANHVLHALCPTAERWIGQFQGTAHEWVRLEGCFVDATVRQFTGDGPVVSHQLDARWQGQRTPWQPVQAWPPGKLIEVHTLTDRVRAVLNGLP